MSEDGEARPPGVPPGQSEPVPFDVVITGEGAASIDGEPVPVLGDQPLDTAILDTLHGYAQLRDDPVTAAISNPATGYAVRVEVGPDGSSRLVGQDGAAADAAEADAAAADAREADAAAPARPAPMPSADPAAGEGPTVPQPAAGNGAPAVAGSAAAAPAGQPRPAEAAARSRTAMPSIPRPSIPRPSMPSMPSIRRPSLPGRSPGSGKAAGGATRGSDVEFVPTSLLKKPWVVGGVAVAVAALVTTPLALAGASSGGTDQKADGKIRVEDPKEEPDRGPGGSVHPSRPPYPSGSPSGSPSPKDKDDEKDKPKSADSKPEKSDDDAESDEDTAKDSGSSDKKSSGDKDKHVKKAPKRSRIPHGVTMVVNRKTGRCLDVPGTGKGKPDGPVQQGACDTTAGARGGNQRWKLDLKVKDGGPGKADLYLIRNVKDNLCLDLAGYGPVAARAPVTEYHCRPKNDNQLWWLDKRSNGTYWIRNHESGNQCLDVAGAGEKTNARLLIFGCDDADDHQWRFKKP
ncbi:RICIN domain-containing protein [Streptomyces qinglanensis]|uniref:Ricin-type beta-trefoil lectin domain-containing protein n=1 Tax=Streptomyces qinglanensis TaxID=943816 RepID=A0A1H9SB80_9ACTN|nr:RICIN domain-containing protein [Streptomyces qinglanensis]SER82221.1 Ricin-type beta-trefoil lectin domain-containing protein [Streptomyces qinglanensis]